MATVLRPPLVYSPLQKRPIPAVDYFSRPLTLGINPNAQVRQHDQSAPLQRARINVESAPNLLTTTLAQVPSALALPQLIELLDDSASRRRAGLSGVDVYPNLLGTTLAPTLTIPLPLGAVQLDLSAPPRKSLAQVDAYANLPSTTLRPIPPFAGHWSDSAPARRPWLVADPWLDLSATTLAPPSVPLAMPLLSQQMDAAAPRRRPVVTVEVYPNLSQTTLATPAATLGFPLLAVRWDWSAPQVRPAVQVDQPLIRSNALNPVPQIQRMDQGTPIRKSQVRVDTTPNQVILQQPLIQRLADSAPQQKYAVQVDAYSNLRGLVASAVLGKPLGYPYDFSTFQPKYAIQLDTYPNTVLLGIVTVLSPISGQTAFVAGPRSTTITGPDSATIYGAATVVIHG